MHILMITGHYPPEIRTISYMAYDLAQGLAERGHDVCVTTCWPQYNLSPEARQTSFRELSVEDGIKVLRVKTPPHHKVNYLVRGFAQLSLPFLFMRKINKFQRQRFEAVIVYTPPLPLALVGARIKKRDQAKYLLNIGDIFPQNAIDLGIMKNKGLIQFFERMERISYKNADAIIVNTLSNVEFLKMNKGVPASKLHFIPDWEDISRFAGVRPAGKFRQEFGLKDKFIFLFAGILGPSQNLDFILEIALKLADRQDICFLFVGDGTEKPRLQSKVKGYGLPNVAFHPFVSKEDYALLVKDVDAGLVCLDMKNRTSVVPGKIFGYMAAAIPIVAFLNRESDTHRIIEEARCGFSMLSDDSTKAAGLIRKIVDRKNNLAAYGKNGADYIATYSSKKKGIDTLEGLIAKSTA